MNQGVTPQEKDDGIKCSLCDQAYNGACPTKSSDCPFTDNVDDKAKDKQEGLRDVPSDLTIDDEFDDFLDDEDDDLLLDPLEEYE